MPSVQPIVAGSITKITGLKERPVYFLTLNNAPKPSVVVKGDAEKPDSAVSIAWGSKLMKNVQNEWVNTKIMTPAEIDVFKNAAWAAFAQNTPQYDNVKPGGMSYCWVKMPFVEGLSDAEFYNDDYTINLKQIKELIKRLSDAAIWAELGKIVAVDIFNGNSDRFAVDPQGASKLGTWTNRGNIMFLGAGHNHTTPVIGLDTFDPNSQVGNLKSGGGHENLKILIDQVKRNEFAKACVRSVGEQIRCKLADSGHHGHFRIAVQGADGPNIITIPIKGIDYLFDAYADDMAAGITLGADQLKLYLQGKVRQYTPARPNVALPAPPRPANLPPGVQPRAAWQPGVVPPRPGAWVAGAVPAAAAAPAAAPIKTIPQGILDRMAYLGW
ncbi:MAG TPA: hypothetical protein VHW24_10915 [Bryobacteraceae bacterium]|nr:hypothetical protein [Bryobacteraceae bacterium]